MFDLYNGTPAQNFVDSRYIEDEDEMRKVLRASKPIRFDWENKWLRGDQYAHMLYNLDNYSAVFGMQKLSEKTHPENIYVQPESKQKFTILQLLFARWLSLLRSSQHDRLRFWISTSRNKEKI